MRNSSVKTPKNTRKSTEHVKADKSSGKKMVQARLPFKIISSSPSSPSASKDIVSHEVRKRKLSMQSDEDDAVEENVKENLDMASKKKQKTTVESVSEVVIVLDDDNDDENDNYQDNINNLTDNDEAEEFEDKNLNENDDDQLKIKLPISQKKKRKSKQMPSSDDDKDGVNPKKRSKTDKTPKSMKKTSMKLPKVQNSQEETKLETVLHKVNGKAEEVLKEAEISNKSPQDKAEQQKIKVKSQVKAPKESVDVKEKQDDVQIKNAKNLNKSKKTPTPSKIPKNAKTNQCDGIKESQKCTTAAEKTKSKVSHWFLQLKPSSENEQDNKEHATQKSDTESEKESNTESELSEVQLITEDTDNLRSDSSFNVNKSLTGKGDKKNVGKKSLTPKQLKLMEQRRRVREEKERKLLEERERKQKEKEEQKQLKMKEREEKEQQKRREREEKNQKKQAEIDAKNEEKRKRNEAKEEERKRKEQEKVEVTMKKKKAAEAFTKFFVPKVVTNTEGCATTIAPEEVEEQLAFRPFEVKGDMKLAPILRKEFSAEAKQQLDRFLTTSEAPPVTELYLAKLKTGKIVPHKYRRSSMPDNDDIQLIDDLERVGVAIMEEAPVPVERFRTKFYMFSENRRPPYYGTWRKKTKLITPRRPFAQDQTFFDYEVDSDLEWEDEEPGESLDGSEDDKEKESEDDEYEVDNEWFVPHGHLSEEELQNEDENGMNDNTREAQKAKLKFLQQEFAEEMKKKTEKIKPRLIGCIWVDENGNMPEQCPRIIWDTLQKRAMIFTAPPLLEDPEMPEADEQLAKQELSESLVKDLVQLVHGNRHSRAFLVKEFLAYYAQKEEDLKIPIKSTAVREKIDELAKWQTFVLRRKTKKKKNKKFLCWTVSAEVLNRLQLQDLGLLNKWTYNLTPKYDGMEDEHGMQDGDEVIDIIEGSPEQKKSIIKQFTKILTPEEKLEQMQKLSQQSKNETLTKSPIPAPPATAEVIKKRVPLLMSVPRGQQINTTTKNALINQFLKTNSSEATLPKDNSCNNSTSPTIAKSVAPPDVILIE